MTEWTKPLPTELGETKPFWDACRRGEYLIQRCRACGRHQAYYRGGCAHCWSQDLEDLVSSGRGRVLTFTVTYQNQTPGFKEEVPYVVAVVALEEGPGVITNIVNCDPESVRIDQPVKVLFRQAGDFRIPYFEPA